jgi:hypothetical protein
VQIDDKSEAHSHHAKSGSKSKTPAESAAHTQSSSKASKVSPRAFDFPRARRSSFFFFFVSRAFLFDSPCCTAQQSAKSVPAAPEPQQKVPEPIFWVKCDECDRWRIINGLTHEEQTKLMKKSWYCKMHPDAAQRECDKVVSRVDSPRLGSACTARICDSHARR